MNFIEVYCVSDKKVLKKRSGKFLKPTTAPLTSTSIRCFQHTRSLLFTWSVIIQISWNKRKFYIRKVFTPHWTSLEFFGVPTWPPWRHVKTMNKPLTNFFLLCIGLNEMVPDSLLSVFDEYELEVSAVLILLKTSLSL